MKPELARVIQLSLAHLRPETVAVLRGPLDQWPVSGGPYPYREGFFIYAHDENDGSIPFDLWNCCVFARIEGADYIVFDSEDEPTPGLAVYTAAEAEGGARADALDRILRDTFAEVRQLIDNAEAMARQVMDGR